VPELYGDSVQGFRIEQRRLPKSCPDLPYFEPERDGNGRCVVELSTDTPPHCVAVALEA
jgi:peptide/nickel transport system ATP-binding protein